MKNLIIIVITSFVLVNCSTNRELTSPTSNNYQIENANVQEKLNKIAIEGKPVMEYQGENRLPANK